MEATRARHVDASARPKARLDPSSALRARSVRWRKKASLASAGATTSRDDARLARPPATRGGALARTLALPTTPDRSVAPPPHGDRVARPRRRRVAALARARASPIPAPRGARSRRRVPRGAPRRVALSRRGYIAGPRRASLRTRAAAEPDGAEGGAEPAPPAPEVKSDPFGFGTSTGEPDKIQPGFDTAEGGKVGPVGTFFISVLLIVLFGASFFFTSVPRNAIEGLVDLSDDPNAPTQRF